MPILKTFIRHHWDALLASLTACCFLYYFTRHSGIGISPDSVVYLSTAENILQHFSFTDFTGLPLVIFPIGYPLFLAKLAFLFGKAPVTLLPVANGLLLTGVLIMTSSLIRDVSKHNSLYKPLILSLLACSPALLEIYSMAWSETLFLFLMLLFALSFRKYLQTPRLFPLIVAALVAAAAFITRYAGVCLLLTGGILLLFDGALPRITKIRHLILFSFLAASQGVLNLVRNSLVSGNSTGVREKALRSFADTLYQAGSVLADWFPFLKGHATLSAGILVCFLIGCLLGFFYAAWQQDTYPTSHTILSCFALVYLLFLLTLASISRFEDISNRLLSPVYIPLLVLSTSWLPALVKRSGTVWKLLLIPAALFLYGSIQYQQYRLNADAWEGIKDAGIPGYAEDSWTQSPTIQYIKQHRNQFSGTVYANANDAVFYLTGIKAFSLPHKEIDSEKTTFLQQPQFYLIWLTDGANEDLLSLPLIQQQRPLDTLASFADGAIYHYNIAHK